MRQSITSLLSAFVALAAIASAQNAVAAPVLDQANTTPLYVGYCTGTCQWQQTITAGMTGKLTGVSLFGTGLGDIRIGFGAGFNSGNWAANVQDVDVGNQAVVDLTGYNLFVTAGQQFVIDVSGMNGSLMGTYTNLGLGQLYLTMPQSSMNGYAYSPNYALGYQTFVDTTPDGVVPEPMSMALIGLGLFGLAAARRSRK